MLALYFTYYIINLVAAMICFSAWKKEKVVFKFQWIYLSLNLLSELSAHFLKNLKIDFLFIYNIFIPIEFVFYISLLRSELKSKMIRKIAMQSNWFFCIIGAINLFFLQEYFEYNYLYMLRCVIFIVFIAYYFYELYDSDEVFSITQIPTFWISIGFFVFCVSTFLIMGFNSMMSKIDFELTNSVYQSIIVSLNILLYGTFIVASLCTQKKYSL